MIGYGFFVGLMLFLTPWLFPFIFILGIVSQKLAINTKLYWVNALLVLLSFTAVYFIVIEIRTDIMLVEFFNFLVALINFSFILLFLFLSAYLIGFFDLKNSIKLILGILVSIVLGAKLSVITINSSTPILGSYLANGSGNMNELFDFIKGEGLAVCLSIALMLFISRKIAHKFKDKPWSENIPKLLGVYLFSVQIISIYNLFNV